MAKSASTKPKSDQTTTQAVKPINTQARSLLLANKGVSHSGDLVKVLAATITDVLEGTITTAVANAISNTASKIIRTLELEHKIGQTQNLVRTQINLQRIKE